MRTTKPLFILVLSLYPLFTLHSALMHGYFVDGMIYASLARNLAEGYGSFWDMRFSDELFRHFQEHPPLGIYIQSLFYRLFGDTELIDKFYGFVIGFGILGLIAAVRKRLYGDYRGSWFALLIFLLLPLSTYVLSYNWLEHILTLTIMASSLVALVAVTDEKRGIVITGGLVAGFLIFVGIMIKGPTALYPLAIPFFAWLCLPEVSSKRAAGTLALMLGSLFFSTGLLILTSEQAVHFFDSYLHNQVLGSLRGERSVHSRTKLLESLLTEELISPLLILAMLMWWSKTAWNKLSVDRHFWFFLGMALSGSVPLMFSPKQNDYYLFISMPFYALAIAALFEPLRQSLENRVNDGRRLIIAALVFIILTPVIMLARQGDFRKDKAYHQSFTEISVGLPERIQISTCPEKVFFADWNVAANFQRYYSATLSRRPDLTYLLTTQKDADHCVNKAHYTLLSHSDTPYLLYKKKMP